MPKSKVRKKNDFAVNSVSRTPVMVIGLAWLLVFQLASSSIPFLADLGPWNYAIAFAFMITGLLLTMRWR
jgi:Cell division protein CrgA